MVSFALVAGVGFEPHDLRVMSPTSYRTALPRDILLLSPWHPSLNGAGDRDRTGTILSYHGILSPGRLPVPPHRHYPPGDLLPFSVRIGYYTILSFSCQYLFCIFFILFPLTGFPRLAPSMRAFMGEGPLPSLDEPSRASSPTPWAGCGCRSWLRIFRQRSRSARRR